MCVQVDSETDSTRVTRLVHSTYNARLILGWRPANERRRYKVKPSLIGWAQT